MGLVTLDVDPRVAPMGSTAGAGQKRPVGKRVYVAARWVVL